MKCGMDGLGRECGQLAFMAAGMAFLGAMQRLEQLEPAKVSFEV